MKNATRSKSNCTQNKTTIEFTDVNKRYYDASASKVIDKRTIAYLSQIKESILDYLLIKLFLLKRSNIPFCIKLLLDNDSLEINYSDIYDLKSKCFSINSQITNEDYEFTLYYYFIKDNKNSKKVHYCANARSTKLMDDDALGFSCALPNKDSFIMLLCSKYFDDKDNDSRDDLSLLSSRKQPTIDVPLLYSTISPYLKKCMHEVILENYPQVEDINRQEEDKAIETMPHLTKYIKANKDILKSEKSLIADAENSFAAKKIQVKQKFDAVLKNKDINQEYFEKAVSELSEIASIELGEYILYRDSIIKALNDAVEDKEQKEKFIHNIFMPMKTSSFGNEESKHMICNFWLLDDKFMTYAYAASDKSIKNIIDEIQKNRSESSNGLVNNRPDLAIFFNKKDERKELIMVEFKGANARHDEKTKALTELPDDIDVVRKNIVEVEEIWSYIITVIDERLKNTIENQESYTPLFTEDADIPMYYKFYEKKKTHLYIVDIRSIVKVAKARNETILDILKQQS
jgi:hypothetical protein